MTVQEIRQNLSLRDDFLFELAQGNASNIARVAVQMIGKTATEDLIRNEITQAFYLGANRGIDTYKAEDDGRGNSSLIAYCRWRGLNHIKDWCRVEYGTDTRALKKYFERTNVILESELNQATFQSKYLVDAVEYDSFILSVITIQEMLTKLSPIDRSILQLLIFGKDEFGSIRNSTLYGSRYRNVAGDIALTIGKSKQYVYQRLSALKATYAEIAA